MPSSSHPSGRASSSRDYDQRETAPTEAARYRRSCREEPVRDLPEAPKLVSTGAGGSPDVARLVATTCASSHDVRPAGSNRILEISGGPTAGSDRAAGR